MKDCHWKYYPALRIGLPYAVGIAVARALELTPEQCLIPLCGALALLCVAILRDRAPLPLFAILLFCGALSQSIHGTSAFDGLEGQSVTDAELVGRVAGDPIFKAGRIELRVACDSLLFRGASARPRTDVLLSIHDSSAFDPGLIPRFGDHILVAGRASVPAGPVNPGEFDQAAYLAGQGIGMTMSASRASAIYIVEHGDLTWIERVVLPIRHAAQRFADRFVRGEEGDIVRALLVGERDYIDPETRRSFMLTGTIHVLSVSGLHVGVIALVLFVAVSWLRDRRMQFAAFAILLALYTVVAGAGPSILRASIMAAAFMLARVAGRIARPLNTLGVAFIAILAFNPVQLFDIGFQLSFASVAGITMLYGPAERAVVAWLPPAALRGPGRAIAQLVILSICAQLFTLPLVLHHFGYLSVVSILVNMPVVPLYSIALGAALFGVAVGTFAEPLAVCSGAACHAVLRLAGAVVELGAGAPGAGIDVPRIDAAGAFAIGAALLYLAFSRRAGQAAARLAIVVLTALAAVLMRQATDPLAGDPSSLVVLLKGREGMLAATISHDTVVAVGPRRGDSAASMRAVESLRRRLGASAFRMMWLDDLDRDPRSAGARYCVINDAPREIALTDPPVLLSNTARRPIGYVRIQGARFLQVPLRANLDEALVLRFDGGWRPVAWR
jgi:competence protein ComEC